MKVRKGRPEEAAALTEPALRSKGHWGYDEEFLAACRDELAVRPAETGPRRTEVAEEDGRILGFTTLERGASPGSQEPRRTAPTWT